MCCVFGLIDMFFYFFVCLMCVGVWVCMMMFWIGFVVVLGIGLLMGVECECCKGIDV